MLWNGSNKNSTIKAAGHIHTGRLTSERIYSTSGWGGGTVYKYLLLSTIVQVFKELTCVVEVNVPLKSLGKLGRSETIPCMCGEGEIDW